MTILTAIDADPGCKEVIETAHELATGLDMELVITHVVPEESGKEEATAEIQEIVQSVIDDLDTVDLRLNRSRMQKHDVKINQNDRESVQY